MNLKQSGISVKEYAFMFTKLPQYSPSLVANSMVKKFILGVSNFVKMECKSSMLIKEMDISWLMTHAKQIKCEKLQKIRMVVSKKTYFDSGF